ncbi:helix-turn-helix domain-containing protein [Gillisia limnaea]|uniref:Transcriptional regulator, AraC family n=1 Tax=Gillisia limnaea (strain DSM 15749 / LMG 21470 / R-8282) TaxID=865937 RepID=H2BXW2_GILLR|nr:helix-turn-helix domain-containing protein [Gillisia limnaea]EHQ02125.1 transcriptional regulator, AraC family [Gillisia limnaea DSM 15749]
MKSEKERIDRINRMIIEMASGNFSYEVQRSEHDDELETLAVLLNMMAEEMRESFHHYGFVNSRGKYRHIAQITFILNQNFKIQTFSALTAEILILQPYELLGKSFPELLTEDSKKAWKDLEPALENNTFNKTVHLDFHTPDSLIVPAFCSVSLLFNPDEESKKIIITAVQTVVQSEETEAVLQKAIQNGNMDNKVRKKAGKLRVLRRESDVARIKEVYLHILTNLDEPLLSLKELAHHFGTNEFKLKYGFKELYNTTVFRFQTDERLNKASLLVQNSEMPLKTIASITGFKSFPHFSKAFKKKFGYNPSDLRRVSRKK